jgi:opacity protein-like surface antigen
MTAGSRAVVSIGLFAALVLPSALQAQRPPRPPDGGPGFLFYTSRVSLGIRGGFNLRFAGSEIYDSLFTNWLTLDKSDFNAFSVAGDLGVRLTGPVDLVVSGGYSTTSAPSEFNHWVDENEQPITQRTTLSTVPLTLAVRWNLASRGREIGRFVWIPARIVPYIGAGGGVVRYSLVQAGSFVDFADLSIFEDKLTSAGWTPMALVMAGADYSLGKRIFVNADVRYLWANAKLGNDFLGWDDGIDLSGVQFSMGLHVRI